MKLIILVGTMTQTALSVAQAIDMECSERVEQIQVIELDEQASIALFQPSDDCLYLICTSTFGSGDVPDNAQALYASFDSQPRYLGGVRYGVIALGDSMFGDTYAMGGQRFDEKLSDLGATRLGEVLRLDASEDPEPEQAAVAWAGQWLAAALASR